MIFSALYVYHCRKLLKEVKSRSFNVIQGQASQKKSKNASFIEDLSWNFDKKISKKLIYLPKMSRREIEKDFRNRVGVKNHNK